MSQTSNMRRTLASRSIPRCNVLLLAFTVTAVLGSLALPCAEARTSGAPRAMLLENAQGQSVYWRHNWFKYDAALQRWRIIPTPGDTPSELVATEQEFNQRRSRTTTGTRTRRTVAGTPPRGYRTSPPPRPYVTPPPRPTSSTPPATGYPRVVPKPPPAGGGYPRPIPRPTPVAVPSLPRTGGGGGAPSPTKILADVDVEYCANHVLIARSGEFYGGPTATCYCPVKVPNIIGAQLTIRLDKSCGGRFRSPIKYGNGIYSAYIKTTTGDSSGIVSSLYMSSQEGSGNQMEIDFEFLGKDMSGVQLNYYVNGKGGHESFPALGFDPSERFHKYSIDYQSDTYIRWYIDDKLVRQEVKGVAPFPTGPMYLYASMWDASMVLGGKWAGHCAYVNQPYHLQFRDVRVPA